MNIFQTYYSLFALTAFFGTSLAFGIQSFIHPRSGSNFNFAATIDKVDISVPYDAAAKLAYDAEDSSDDFQTFKAKYHEEAVKLVVSKRTHSAGAGEVTKGESTSKTTEKEEETKPQNPIVAKLQRVLRSKQKAYKNYLINQGIELKLKPIYERKGKIDTYTPRPIYDAETERLLMEVWEAKSEVRVVETQSMNSEADRLKEENESLQEGIKRLSAQFKATQEESSRQLSEKAQEISKLSTGLDSLASKLQDKKRESDRKTNDLKSLENKLKALKEIEVEVSRLIVELQEKRKAIASRDAKIASLQSKLDETEAALRVLQEERSSFRKLTRQAWRTISSRVNKRVVRVKNLLVRNNNEEVEEMEDTNGGVHNHEAIKSEVVLGGN